TDQPSLSLPICTFFSIDHLSMDSRSCLICTSPTRNAHLGVDACRACAAFFKRTINSGRNFTCRQGNGKCMIRKKEPFLCRKCRFDRCSELGMKWDGKKEEEEDDPIEGTFEGPSEDITVISETILRKILNEYKYSCDQRKEEESSLRAKNPSEHIRVQDPPHEVYLSKSTFSSECMRINIEGYYSFLSRSFIEFSTLSSVEQCWIIGKCTPVIFLLEGNFLSKKIFKNEKYFMLSLTSVLHLDALDYFLSDEEAEKKQDIIKAMKFYTSKQIEYTWPLIEKADLSETEFVVLITIMVWQFGNIHSMSPSLCSIGEEILREVFSDLHRYYREEMNVDDYSVRMGNLMSLGHAIIEASCLMEEEFTVYSLMDLFHPNAFIRRLFS
ncbi:hypothetical protein PRIPAC_77724, partial [Pristionchus pacificus]